MSASATQVAIDCSTAGFSALRSAPSFCRLPPRGDVAPHQNHDEVVDSRVLRTPEPLRPLLSPVTREAELDTEWSDTTLGSRTTGKAVFVKNRRQPGRPRPDLPPPGAFQTSACSGTTMLLFVCSPYTADPDRRVGPLRGLRVAHCLSQLVVATARRCSRALRPQELQHPDMPPRAVESCSPAVPNWIPSIVCSISDQAAPMPNSRSAVRTDDRSAPRLPKDGRVSERVGGDHAGRSAPALVEGCHAA